MNIDIDNLLSSPTKVVTTTSAPTMNQMAQSQYTTSQGTSFAGPNYNVNTAALLGRPQPTPGYGVGYGMGPQPGVGMGYGNLGMGRGYQMPMYGGGYGPQPMGMGVPNYGMMGASGMQQRPA